MKMTTFFASLAIVLIVGHPSLRAQTADTGKEKPTAPIQLVDGWKTASIKEAGLRPKLLNLMVEFVRARPDLNVHGILIEHDQRLVFERYFSGKDEQWGKRIGRIDFDHNTKHDIRSITKSVVSALVGIALDSGSIASLDDSALKYFPKYKDLATPERNKITIRHLLTMSSGLQWDETVPYTDPNNDEIAMTRSEDPIRYVLSRPLKSAPGDSWRYSGGDTQLLAAILERATETRITDYVKEELFSHLKISDYEWLGDLDGMPAAASGLRLRPRDLAKFGSLYLNDGIWGERQILSKSWVRESTKHHISLFKGQPSGYGFQWWHKVASPAYGTLAFPAAVGNGGQRIFILREKKIAVTILAGRYNDFSDPPEKLLLDFIIPSANQP